jgi:hypothetical protein
MYYFIVWLVGLFYVLFIYLFIYLFYLNSILWPVKYTHIAISSGAWAVRSAHGQI